MKKILSVIMIVALLVTLSACSKEPVEPPVTQQPEPQQPATGPDQPAIDPTLKPLAADNRGIYVLRQEDFIHVSEGVPRLSPEVVKIDGEKIEITGFMAMFSPEGKDYIYLVRTPEIDCTFCVGSELADQIILTVYLEPGKVAKWMSGPILVTGTLKMDEIEDDSGMINYLNVMKAVIKTVS